MKNLIIITQEKFQPDEASIISQMIENGVYRVHIRKPCASIRDIEKMLQNIPSQYHKRLVLHDGYSLAKHYEVGGLHLNSRNTTLPEFWNGYTSRSCHTLHDISIYKQQHNYLLLSPIFDSISKQGYKSPFTTQSLLQAHYRGIIDNKVIALGGITCDNISQVVSVGFGGVALLGYIWKYRNTKEIIQIVKQIQNQLSCYNS